MLDSSQPPQGNNSPPEKTKKRFQHGTHAWAEDLRTRTRELAESLDTGYMTLGELLYTAWDVPIDGAPTYEIWGHKSFTEYAFKEFGLHRRKAEFLRKIYYVVRKKLKLHYTKERRLIACGYSKVRELVSVLSPRNVDDWIALAEESSYAQLSEKIKLYREAARTAAENAERRGLDPEDLEPEVGDVDDMTYERFAFFEDQHAVFQQAMEVASRISRSEKKTHNLTLILQDFLATNGAAPKGHDAFRRYLANLERLFGMRLVAFDRETRPAEMLWGASTLEEVLDEAENHFQFTTNVVSVEIDADSITEDGIDDAVRRAASDLRIRLKALKSLEQDNG